jgi:hypothetical protein
MSILYERSAPTARSITPMMISMYGGFFTNDFKLNFIADFLKAAPPRTDINPTHKAVECARFSASRIRIHGDRMRLT